MRVAIISEQPASTQALLRAISLQPAHRVIWVAEGGAAGERSCALETPDVLVVALPLETHDGGHLTGRIMASSPCPILIVTKDVHANAAFVFDAMGYGALDAVDTPTLDAADRLGGAPQLLAKLDTIARLNTGMHARHESPRRAVWRSRESRDPLVVIGASAGGPSAVATVLRGLRRDFPAGIVVVQHVDEEFVTGLAEWLTEQSGLNVSIAEDGERPVVGRVLLAGGAGHLTLASSGRLAYTAEPRHCAYRPSVDVFFQSVGAAWRGDVVGVLLTGMGKDGAVGLKALRDKQHHTIAQDEASSAVYGMPKAAVALDAVVEVLPLARIAPRLSEVVVCEPSLRAR